MRRPATPPATRRTPPWRWYIGGVYGIGDGAGTAGTGGVGVFRLRRNIISSPTTSRTTPAPRINGQVTKAPSSSTPKTTFASTAGEPSAFSTTTSYRPSAIGQAIDCLPVPADLTIHQSSASGGLSAATPPFIS